MRGRLSYLFDRSSPLSWRLGYYAGFFSGPRRWIQRDDEIRERVRKRVESRR